MHRAGDAPDERADSVTTDPERTVAAALRGREPVLLAISGGLDSMALLHAAACAARHTLVGVATFDHGTGEHARRALDVVAGHARRFGLPFRSGGVAAETPRSEAAWREARWRFLRGAAAATGAACIATAHTRDDQVETVAIRILRHAGARGLAGLDVDSDIVRPWLGTSRASVARYAERHGIAHVEDPSNRSRAHLRNRVRLDLLPALRRVRPAIDDDLAAVGDAAARWRRAIEHLAHQTLPLHRGDDGLSIAASELARYDAASLAVLWPVLAAGLGIALDRRGLARLTHFTQRARVGTVMQISGGIEVLRSRFSFVLRRTSPSDAGLGITVAPASASPGSSRAASASSTTR